MITARTRVIAAIACAIGAAAGVLTYLASRALPQALLAAGTATSGSAHLLSQVIGTDPGTPTSGEDNDQDGDLDELCARADAGDQNAAGELAVLLAKRGDLDGAAQILRARADAGNARRLAVVLTRQGRGKKRSDWGRFDLNPGAGQSHAGEDVVP
jgi:hypothetical protein